MKWEVIMGAHSSEIIDKMAALRARVFTAVSSL